MISKNNNQKTELPIESGMTFGKDSSCHSQILPTVILKSYILSFQNLTHCHSQILPTVIPANAGIHNQFFGYSLENSKNNNQKTGFPIRSGMTFGKDSNCHSKTSHIVIPKPHTLSFQNPTHCHSRERGNP